MLKNKIIVLNIILLLFIPNAVAITENELSDGGQEFGENNIKTKYFVFTDRNFDTTQSLKLPENAEINYIKKMSHDFTSFYAEEPDNTFVPSDSQSNDTDFKHTEPYYIDVVKQNNNDVVKIFAPSSYYKDGEEHKNENLLFKLSYKINKEDLSFDSQDEVVDYLIITDSSLYNTVNNNFKDWKIENDDKINTIHIKNISDITSTPDYWVNGQYGDATVSGNPWIDSGKEITSNFDLFNDTQCKIRNCIRHYVDAHSTDYVLLFGNDNIVPSRIVMTNAHSGPDGSWYNEQHASDRYYSCLDYSLNNNTDSYWMENKFDDSIYWASVDVWDEIDWAYDVLLGRVLVESTTEADNWITKMKSVDFKVDTGVVASKDSSNNIDDYVWGEIGDEFLDNTSFVNGQNINQNQWDILDDYSNGDVTGWEDGIDFIHHSGHGGTLYTPYRGSNLDNSDMPNFVYSEGCHSADFGTDTSSRMENWISDNGGAWGGVANSAYGWFIASTWYGEETVSRMFNKTRGILEKNYCKAHSDALESIGWQLHSVSPMIVKSENFFGDPAWEYKEEYEPAEEPTEIEMQPNSMSFNFTETTTINLTIYVTPGTTIDTVSTDLITFTPSTLQCQDIRWGDLFSDATLRMTGTINNTEGTITDHFWGSAIETSDPGEFCTLEFDVINPGYGEVLIDNEYAGVAYQMDDLPFNTTNFTLNTKNLFLTNEYPVNQSKGISKYIQLAVNATNTLGEPMDLYWKSDATGEIRNLDVDNGIYDGRYNTSCYGVIESPYNQTLEYLFSNRSSSIFHDNGCPGVVLGDINKVEIHTTSSTTFKPIFNGFIDGETYSVGSTYTDITYDDSAPTTWNWDDIKNLDLYSSSSSSTYIVVTYDLGYGEGVRVDWSAHLTDGTNWVNESYWYVTEEKTPVISNPSPYDRETWNSYNPTLSVDVEDPNGDSFNVSFYYLSDTGWQQLGLIQTGGNETYSQTTNVFTDYSETYYWKVEANDGINTDTEYFRFTMRNIQLPPENFNAEKWCDNSINLSWTKPEYVDNTRIQRRINDYPETIDDGLNIYNGTEESVVDTSVVPGQTYYYTAWSWNETDGTWSELNSTATNSTSPSTPTNFIVETIDYHTINLSWTKGDGSDTTLIRRKLGSYPTDRTDGTFVYDGTDNQYSDDTLGSNVTYYYKIWAYNLDYSCDSTTGFSTTDVGPPLVQTNDATNIENTVARINGYLVGDGGETTTVGFIWENETSQYNTTIGTYSMGESFYLDISGLIRAETYSFKTWASNTYGYLEGNIKYFNTKPYAPTNLTVTDVKSDSINLSWINGSGSDITMVRYKIGSYPIDVSDGTGSLVYDNKTSITGLEQNYTYYFRIWSYNDTEDFYSTDYDEISQGTIAGEPSIDTISPTNLENQTATLRATLDNDGGENCTCGFRWGSSSGVYTNNQTSGSYSEGSTVTLGISGLSKGNTYYYQAWAKNQIGLVYGDEVSFETRPQEPQSFVVDAYGARQINLSWINGQGSNSVLIKKKSSGYPSSTSDGTTVYTGSGTEYYDELLNENTTWFYRIWSYNGLYSTDNVSDYDTTGFLPNIIFMSPCDETNIDRPPVLQAQGTGNSPLIYTFYGYQGDAPTITGDWATGETMEYCSRPDGSRYFCGHGWEDDLNGDGSLDYYDDYTSSDSLYNLLKDDGNLTIGWLEVGRPSGTGGWRPEGKWYYGEPLSIGLENQPKYGDYQLISGIEVNDNFGLVPECNPYSYDDVHAMKVQFHRYFEDDWITLERREGNSKNWDLSQPEYIDEIRIRYGLCYFSQPGRPQHLTVKVSSVDFCLPPEEICANTSVSSGELKNCIWNNVTSEGQEYAWVFEVSDGIDSVFEQCTFTTEETIVSDAYPDGSNLYTYPSHECSVQVNHTGGDLMDVYFYYYNTTTTSYELGGQTLNSANDSFTWIYPESGTYGETYHWRVCIWDGLIWHNETYEFDITYHRIIFSDISPPDSSTVGTTYSHNCSLHISHHSSELMDIVLYSYNETTSIYEEERTWLQVGEDSYYFIYNNTDIYDHTYHWRVIATDENGTRTGDYSFDVRGQQIPQPPDFCVSSYNATTLLLDSINGDSLTDSIMIRADDTSYPENRMEGTLLFNGTLSEYIYNNLNPLKDYYFTAWAYNQSDNAWSGYTQKTGTTDGPQPPSFTLSKINSTRIDIESISMNEYSNKVYIRAKKGSIPSTMSDGFFVCNTSESSHSVYGLNESSLYYFKAWAWNETYNVWSNYTVNSQHTNGGITISSFVPADGVQVDGINPALSAYVSDYNNDETLDVYFRSNESSMWSTIKSKSVTEGQTVTYNPDEFSYQNKWYWWSINVTDGEFWANETLSFQTGSFDIPNVTAVTYNIEQINLSWNKSNYTTHTYIQRKINDYPQNRSDGTNVYFGTGEYFEDTELSPGELYCYRIWSYNLTRDIYSTSSSTTLNLTKPCSPVNFTSETWDYTSINLSWVKGEGANNTVIVYKTDNYPTDRFDGIEIYRGNGNWHIASGLKPNDYLNYYSPLPGTDNFGEDGDPFENSCDDDESTKWDLNESTTGNFSYELGIEPQRVKGFAILYQDFYDDDETDWESSITDFEVYNGSWTNDWSSELYNNDSNPKWNYYESPTYYPNATEVRFSAWTEWITPNIYEVLVGKLGYVHCFRAWSVVTKAGITQYSDEYTESQNRTQDTPENNVPEISNMLPANESVGLNPDIDFSVSVSDQDGQLMNISWQYLDGSNWVEFDSNILVSNGTYTSSKTFGFNETFYWRVVVSDTADVDESSLQTDTSVSPHYWFTVREQYIPDTPSSLFAETVGNYQINLTFSYPSDKIYIEHSTEPSWNRGEGTLVYNSTGLEYEDSGLYSGTHYYYKAWGYNITDSSFSENYISADNITLGAPNERPYAPINGQVSTPITSDEEDYLDVYDITLSCYVEDPDSDEMDISFYWGNDDLIGTINNVSSNSTASLYLPDFIDPDWPEHDTLFEWYAVADDGKLTNQSINWDFTTCKAWDLNVDKTINYLDISLMVAHYLEYVTPAGSETWDINNDGVTNYLDLSSVVAHYLENY